MTFNAPSQSHKISWLMAALLFVAGFTLGLSTRSLSSLAWSTQSLALTSAAPTSTPLPIPTAIAGKQAALINLYARANPAVVNITIFGQQDGEIGPLGQGSGFVYDETGHIVTNAHVVREADQVEVTFSDGLIQRAQIIGQDPNSDLAVLKVAELPAGINPLPLGDMSELAVGQSVVAIGNPFGLEGSMTLGIISALGRTIPALTPFAIPQAIQTDAAINPGNSGGPLLDLHGHVIGVNAQIESSNDSFSNSGVGFAIPINIVSRVVPTLIKMGSYEWAWLGVQGGSVTPTLAEAMNLPAEARRGAYLIEIVPDSPAEQAGLQGTDGVTWINNQQVPKGGDIVTAMDGQPVRSFEDLLVYIALQTRPKQAVTLTILRGGKVQDIKVQLEARPAILERELMPSNHPQRQFNRTPGRTPDHQETEHGLSGRFV